MLWLIGGTSESATLAQALTARSVPYCVTVTTDQGRSLYPAGARVMAGAIASEAMPGFIQAQNIQRIIDASHPFATAVSLGAMAAAQACGIPYLRFERASAAADAGGQAEGVPEGLVRLPNLEALLQPQWLVGERSLLVLGYRMLPRFAPWQGRSQLFARILPSRVALAGAIAAGFAPGRLIALRPPVSPELEIALWRQWQITQVVAKASGAAGGEVVKRAVAEELGIRLILLDRPTVAYPCRTGDLEGVLAFATGTASGFRNRSEPRSRP